MDKAKQVLHEKLLDADHALLITYDKDGISLDFLGDPVKMGGKLSFLFTKEIDLVILFTSAISSAAVTSVERGDVQTAREIRDVVAGSLNFIIKGMLKAQN